MKIIFSFFSLIMILITITGCVSTSTTPSFENYAKNNDTLYHSSPINALLEGDYNGSVTVKELKQHGNLGLGTFSGLDGEMIALNGIFYRIDAGGAAHFANNTMKTPFAVVTFFEKDKKLTVLNIESLEHLKQVTQTLFPTKNIFYAIKIDGSFHYVKTRSVPKQYKPYKRLEEAIKEQQIREFENIEGTLVGFWCPEYIKNINVPGYHFHFISKNRSSGGHLLECQIKEATIEIDNTTEFYVALPETQEFFELDLSGGKEYDLEKVEKDQ